MLNTRSTSLTSEERNILYLTLTGHSQAQAARILNLTQPETQQALERLLQRTGVSSRSALIVHAIVNRWV